MRGYSIYFEIALFPENTSDTLFDNYICSKAQIEYVLSYFDGLI
jgi:hypothetical protein